MLGGFHKGIVSLLMLTVLGISCACTPVDQAQVETAMASVMETAAADAEKAAKTQAVGMGQTAVASGGTEVSGIQQTAVAAVSTKVASVLTPKPPEIEYEINNRDIILFNVVREITVTEAAFKFSISSKQLIELNKEKYPSITDGRSKLQPEWMLILYVGSPEHADLIPQSKEDWKDIPGCIENQGPMISSITCNQFTLDFVKEVGLNIGCVALPDTNPFGYYIVHSRYIGRMLFYGGKPFIYGLYYDEEKKSVVIGPAIVTDKINLPECAIPGNP